MTRLVQERSVADRYTDDELFYHACQERETVPKARKGKTGVDGDDPGPGSFLIPSYGRCVEKLATGPRSRLSEMMK